MFGLDLSNVFVVFSGEEDFVDEDVSLTRLERLSDMLVMSLRPLVLALDCSLETTADPVAVVVVVALLLDLFEALVLLTSFERRVLDRDTRDELFSFS